MRPLSATPKRSPVGHGSKKMPGALTFPLGCHIYIAEINHHSPSNHAFFFGQTKMSWRSLLTLQFSR